MKTNTFRKYMKEFCRVLNRKKTDEWVYFKFYEDDDGFRITAVRHLHEVDVICSVSKIACRRYLFLLNAYIGDSIILSWDTPIYGKFSTTAGVGIPNESAWLFNFIGILKAYAETPLDEREDEKFWSIHLAEDGILCLKLSTKEYLSVDPWNIEDYNDDKWYQNKFTRSEIANYLKTDDEKIVDWFIERFGEEVTE